MHVVKSKFTSASGRVYETVLLRESYREEGKVKKRTVANLSGCKAEEIEAIRVALSKKTSVTTLADISLKITSGKSVGAVWTVYEVAKQLGIVDALGASWEAQLALWQVIARVIDQGSRLSAVRLGEVHALASVLNMQRGFDENDLYTNLHWLADRQEEIEDNLFKKRTSITSLFLYDVTSSYLEGENNALSDWGYNRDGKKGKKQIVIGLLCDEEGNPASVEVFKGNTQDTTTFSSQIVKIKERFHCENITVVGDRGMIKSGQITNLLHHGLHYITAITKPQIERLIQEEVISYSLFAETLCEVIHEGVKYILKKNPVRAQECQETRDAKQRRVEEFVREQNAYLVKHAQAKPEAALKKVKKKLAHLKISSWLSVEASERILELHCDEHAKEEEARLDGCYALKTDLLEGHTQTIHKRYKDLALVEHAFRTCKSDIDIRPVFVRTSKSTYGHVFIVMLAYMIIRKLDQAWQNLYLTTREGLDSLTTLALLDIQIGERSSYQQFPNPSGPNKQMLEALNLNFPAILPKSEVRVVTRKGRRKQDA